MKWNLKCLVAWIYREYFHNHKWTRTLDIHCPMWPLENISEIEICDCGATRYKNPSKE